MIQVWYTPEEYRFGIRMENTGLAYVWASTCGKYSFDARLGNISFVHVRGIQVWYMYGEYRFGLQLQNTDFVYVWGIQVWFTSRNTGLAHVWRIRYTSGNTG